MNDLNYYIFIKKDDETRNYCFFQLHLLDLSITKLNVNFQFERKDNIRYHSCKEKVYFRRETEKDTLFVYMKSTNDTIKMKLIHNHRGPALLEVNRKIYIVSGKFCEYFDFESNEGISLPCLNENRFYGHLFYSEQNGFLYSFGGLEEGSDKYLNISIERINLLSNSVDKWTCINLKNSDLIFGYFNSYIKLESNKAVLSGGFNNENCSGIESISQVDFNSNEIEKVRDEKRILEFRDSTFFIDSFYEKAYNYDSVENEIVCFDINTRQIKFIPC
jgi:hypothetical protein